MTWPSSIAVPPERHEREQVVEDEEEHRAHHDLRRRQRQEHQQVRAAGDRAAPAGQAEGEARRRAAWRPASSARPARGCSSIAWRSDGSCSSERVSSPHHQRNEKPCHVLRERPELNENWMAISTGTIDHST